MDPEARVAKAKNEYELAVAELALLAAKEQYHATRTPEAKAAKDAAAARVMELREVQRADRPIDGPRVFVNGEPAA